MMSLEQYTAQTGQTPDVAACPKAGPDDDLDTLVGLSVDQEHPVVIIDDGKPVGVVTKDALLHGIKGEV